MSQFFEVVEAGRLLVRFGRRWYLPVAYSHRYMIAVSWPTFHHDCNGSIALDLVVGGCPEELLGRCQFIGSLLRSLTLGFCCEHGLSLRPKESGYPPVLYSKRTQPHRFHKDSGGTTWKHVPRFVPFQLMSADALQAHLTSNVVLDRQSHRYESRLSLLLASPPPARPSHPQLFSESPLRVASKLLAKGVSRRKNLRTKICVDTVKRNCILTQFLCVMNITLRSHDEQGFGS